MKNGTARPGLSDGGKRLTELMTRIGYGHIEALTVRNGKPHFDPMPKIVREIRMKPVNSPKPSSQVFEPKTQVLELLRHLRQIDNGIVQRIEIQGGLPFRISIEGFDELEALQSGGGSGER